MAFTWKSAVPLRKRILSFVWRTLMPPVVALVPLAMVGYIMLNQ